MWMLGSFTQAEAEAEYRRERIVADYAPRSHRENHRGILVPRRRGGHAAARRSHQPAVC